MNKRKPPRSSKSRFMRGTQCHKSLYLHCYHPEFRDELSESQEAVFQTGTDIGRLAWNLFPNGVDLSPESMNQWGESIRRTQELIEENSPIMYEAAFDYEEMFCAVDILVRRHKGWVIYEVKSSTSVKPQYILDAAVQYYVLKGLGLNVDQVNILHVDNQYILEGELNYQKYFHAEDVTEMVLELQDEIYENIQIFKDILIKEKIPKIDIGEWCNDPYPCDFSGYCWKHIPEYSIFDISRLSSKRKFELYHQGIVRFEDIPIYEPLSESQKLQIECELTGKRIIRKGEIKSFLETLHYPLYFFDFETFNPAVPRFNFSRPYQRIPFQYSLHVRDKQGGQLRHKYFLGDGKHDPREELIKQMISDIGPDGNIVVYNQGFEKGVLKEIARDYPQYTSRIMDIHDRVVDMLKPFRKKMVYYPEMKGSASIKSVLPALYPDLTYQDLMIHDGGMAMNAYENLYCENDQEKINNIREDLLAYCRLDTLAMVNLLDKLEEFAV